ncbi:MULTISPECIES: PhzF family phenazine biosynthesis protein [unclassified Bacillus (in: firmicutes)]|uniref:PhzF family phenazine biosynthesis protein n=1 Tax=unclassified Bacillus (in: firmicutes) TaxID=185979 RepID=UPI0008DF21CF|nr:MULTISPECIES: PhzF family phenazine biosynthesis protein [unclassified Bacillus (in: firmicutes)]SFJ51272.1 phenazine biosynthesis protein PhzF family [Bacillus sp. 71mf]SFT04924.1 phenazine biosynthesis protein PhzF family [Bacillus sp. 103mf]
MHTVKVYHYDAFSNKTNKGNPAGVVLHADKLTDDEMQNITYKVGFNETAFLMQSSVADWRIRYFTPGYEMDLCGHGTVAAIYALQTRGFIKETGNFTIETKAGILPIQVKLNSDRRPYIMMKQANPQFQKFDGSREELAASIGLHENDLEENLPIVYGSTGNWTLLVPVKKLASFKEMKPNNKLFPSILKEMPRASVHPFCFETYDSNAHMHARHFSSAYAGTIEDPVTGTASGVMGAYYVTFIDKECKEEKEFLIEQGHEMGKDGRVRVVVRKEWNGILEVEISGSAVYVDGFEVTL